MKSGLGSNSYIILTWTINLRHAHIARHSHPKWDKS